MTMHEWLGVLPMGLLLIFVVFAGRQGLKVKPSGRRHDAGEAQTAQSSAPSSD